MPHWPSAGRLGNRQSVVVIPGGWPEHQRPEARVTRAVADDRGLSLLSRRTCGRRQGCPPCLALAQACARRDRMELVSRPLKAIPAPQDHHRQRLWTHHLVPPQPQQQGRSPVVGAQTLQMGNAVLQTPHQWCPEDFHSWQALLPFLVPIRMVLVCQDWTLAFACQVAAAHQDPRTCCLALQTLQALQTAQMHPHLQLAAANPHLTPPSCLPSLFVEALALPWM
mmetsp:Transcript_49881/g.131520  ORF Transcript_49881/g.131520 Transcript_49881/m.131520 type:complete len:224 (+) Transcript_49881:378-1049(+)